MIKLRRHDTSGSVYVSPTHIIRIEETGSDQQYMGHRSNVYLTDGAKYMVQDRCHDIAEAVETLRAKGAPE